MPQVRIYYLDETGQEAHMIGDLVAVVWNITSTLERTTTWEDGVKVTRERCVRTRCERDRPYPGWGRPYIAFPTIGDPTEDGGHRAGEDDAIGGALDLDVARQLAAELAWAIAYLEEHA